MCSEHYLLAIILVVLKLICIGAVADDISTEVFKSSYRETVVRAQCQARCLSQYGVVDIPSEYRILDIYKPYSCAAKDLTCLQCMGACNHELTSTKDCKQSCDTRVCRESCGFLFQLNRQPDLNKDEINIKQVNIAAPSLQCQGVSVMKPNNQYPAYMYLKWNVYDAAGNITSGLPLMFVLSTKGVVLGKTPSSFVPIEDLLLGGTYALYVTAVSEFGVVSEMVPSEPLTMSKGWMPSLQPELAVAMVSPSELGAKAVIQWTPPTSTPPCFYQIYWMSADSSSHGSKRFTVPLPEWKYEIDGLNYGENYTVRIYTIDMNIQPEYESLPTISWFTTPTCLEALNYNLNKCAPPEPGQISVSEPYNIYNSTASVTISWKPALNSTDEGYNYTVEFRKLPDLVLNSLGTDDEEMVYPHEGVITVPATNASLELNGLHMNSFYKFYITAVSQGGDSGVRVAEKYVTMYTGDSTDILKSGRITEQHDQDEGAPIYIYILSSIAAAVLVFTLVGICLYKQRVQRIKKKITLPTDIVMTELDYMLDTSMDDMEVNLGCLEVAEELGSGAFGRVFKATLRENTPNGLQKNSIVAVKMVKEFANREDINNLIKEMRLMRHIGKHPCVVSMLACCTKPLQSACIIMDYCANGDLKSYLKTIRDNAYKNVKNKFVTACGEKTALLTNKSLTRDDILSSQSHDDEYSFRAEEDYNYSTYSCASNTSEVSQLLMSFARQIALGMEYLGQRKFVHRDLAARNILVCDDGAIKIADFGLTRDIYENSQYQKIGGGRLPVKWMALESIFDQTYTTQSDVWSYGVVLWEIMTLGGSPYPGISNSELLRLLKNGYRMSKPANCPDELYALMKTCWCELPTDRPSFTEVVRGLEAMMEQATSYMEFDASLQTNDGDNASIDLQKASKFLQRSMMSPGKSIGVVSPISVASSGRLSFFKSAPLFRSIETLARSTAERIGQKNREGGYVETPCKVMVRQRSLSDSGIADAHVLDISSSTSHSSRLDNHLQCV